VRNEGAGSVARRFPNVASGCSQADYTSMSTPLHYLLFACVVLGGAAQAASSPYAGEEHRSIKALSSEDIDGLLAGNGMGYAKAAELNGYPGPLHVLQLAGELQLTPEQAAATKAIEAAMRAEAKSLGAALVEEERKLDMLFASKRVDERQLRSSLKKIGALQADLRDSHLRAHLAQAKVLDAVQTQRYFTLRGYDRAQEHSESPAHQHH
jgi:Spy/CpxP family protein refolding chaperone